MKISSTNEATKTPHLRLTSKADLAKIARKKRRQQALNIKYDIIILFIDQNKVKYNKKRDANASLQWIDLKN